MLQHSVAAQFVINNGTIWSRCLNPIRLLCFSSSTIACQISSARGRVQRAEVQENRQRRSAACQPFLSERQLLAWQHNEQPITAKKLAPSYRCSLRCSFLLAGSTTVNSAVTPAYLHSVPDAPQRRSKLPLTSISFSPVQSISDRSINLSSPSSTYSRIPSATGTGAFATINILIHHCGGGGGVAGLWIIGRCSVHSLYP